MTADVRQLIPTSVLLLINTNNVILLVKRLQKSFNTILVPSSKRKFRVFRYAFTIPDGRETLLQIAIGTIDLAFAGNTNGEATVKQTLITVRKFTTEISEDSFRSYAEAKLFGSADSAVVLWADVKRAAATRTDWPRCMSVTHLSRPRQTPRRRQPLWRRMHRRMNACGRPCVSTMTRGRIVCFASTRHWQISTPHL